MSYTGKLSIKEKAALQKRKWIRLTRVCNNKCVFCLDADQQDGSVISLFEIEEELKMGKKEGAERVVLSGGEPTLHPEFLRIIEIAKEMGYAHIQVVTNGRLFFYINFLYKAVKNGLNEITFSLHGHTQNLHETQTQTKGSFKQSVVGLMNALKFSNVIVNVDVVINKYNYKHLYEIINYFIHLGVEEFDLLQVMPFGRAWEKRKEVLYDIKQAYPYLRKVFELSKKPNVFLWTNRFPPTYLEGFEELIQHPYKLFDEVEGRRRMFEEFLKKGKRLQCYGERCNFCFLKEFCRDLVSFKKQKILKSKKWPKCIKKENEEETSHEKILTFSEIVKKEKIELEKFVRFYIDYRYFLKGQNCEKCEFYKNCSGAPIEYVRKKGFKSLSKL